MPDDITELVRGRWGSLLADIGAGAADRYTSGATLPRKFLTMAGEAGIQGLFFPPDLGGGGLDPVTWGRVLEEIAFQCEEAAFPIILSMSTGVASVLCKTGQEEVLRKYALPLISGERTATLAFSEDADLFSLRTTLRRTEGGYRLSGRKDYITGGLAADLFLTYARDDDGCLVACLVEAGQPGAEVRPAGGIGFRTCGMASLTLHDVELSREQVITAEEGLGHAQLYLNYRRLILSCLVTGLMRALFDRCLSRLRVTVRHDQPVTELPNVQAAVGRMYIAVESAKAMVHETLTKVAAGKADLLFDPAISAAKHLATEQALYVADQAFRVLGGHGYYGDPFYGRYLRDCVGLLCAAGTQEVLEINLGALAVKGAPSRSAGE